MTDTTVKYFDSTMTGAPSLNGTAGSLIGVLDACLQDGFNSITLDSLAIADNVATATYSSGHGFTMQGTAGPVILIAGATPSGLNGEWRVTVTSTTQFTFATSGISNQTATGTITAKRAPLGWTKEFSDTNKAVYLPSILCVPCYLRVDDTIGQYAWGRGYETVSDIDTGTGPFPTAAQLTNGVMYPKSTTGNSTSRPWWLIGDHGIIYFGLAWHATYPTYYDPMCFGDINSLKSGDTYSSLITGSPNSNLPSYIGAENKFAEFGKYTEIQAGKYLARSYTQLGSSVAAGMIGDACISNQIGRSGLEYPHPVDNGLLFAPIGVCHSSVVRSRAMPGIYQPLHSSFLPLTEITDIPDIPGRIFAVVPLTNQGSETQAIFDLTGPWR